MRTAPLHLALCLTLLLAGCGQSDSDAGLGGVTVDDARELDKAAAKLDAETQGAAEPDTDAKTAPK